MKNPLRFIAVASLMTYTAVCGFLYVQQRSLLYFPTPEADSPDAEALWLDNEGVRIKVWKHGSNANSAILYFGGNAEPVERNIRPLSAAAPGYDLYLVNYRGYGGSEGAPSESGIYSDALAVYDLISQDYDESSVIGRSLGSGVATYVAANRSVARSVLITPYDSIEKVAQKKFPIFPVSFLLRDKYDSAARAHLMKTPVLILAAERDGVIPAEHTQALAEKIDEKLLQMEVISGANHLTVSSNEQFWVILSVFLVGEKTLQPQ